METRRGQGALRGWLGSIFYSTPPGAHKRSAWCLSCSAALWLTRCPPPPCNLRFCDVWLVLWFPGLCPATAGHNFRLLLLPHTTYSPFPTPPHPHHTLPTYPTPPPPFSPHPYLPPPRTHTPHVPHLPTVHSSLSSHPPTSTVGGDLPRRAAQRFTRHLLAVASATCLVSPFAAAAPACTPPSAATPHTHAAATLHCGGRITFGSSCWFFPPPFTSTRRCDGSTLWSLKTVTVILPGRGRFCYIPHHRRATAAPHTFTSTHYFPSPPAVDLLRVRG